MKKTLTSKDGTLNWADAREGDRIRVNGSTMLVAKASHNNVLFAGPGFAYEPHTLSYWQTSGAYLEREVEEHPHGLIPTEDSVILITDEVLGTQHVYQRYADVWFYAGGPGSERADRVQGMADANGFEVLWPRPEVTDEMVEELAPRLRDDFYQFWDTTWDETTEGSKRNWRSVASVALEYALGGDK